MRCKHEHCGNEAIECRVGYWGESTCVEFYCPEHAPEHGFCAVCGEFWGGIESFDFGNGLCDNCRSYEDPEESDDDLELEDQHA